MRLSNPSVTFLSSSLKSFGSLSISSWNRFCTAARFFAVAFMPSICFAYASRSFAVASYTLSRLANSPSRSSAPCAGGASALFLPSTFQRLSTFSLSDLS